MSWWSNLWRHWFPRSWNRSARSVILRAPRSARLDLNAATRLELLAKSRYFMANSPVTNRLAGIFEIYTTGGGVRVIPDSSDESWNERARTTFDSWSWYPDLESRQSWGSLQSLMARSWFTDGEVFVLLTQDQAGRPRLQLLGAEQVRSPTNIPAGQRIIDGVELDGAGQPVAYYVWEADNGSPRRIESRSLVHVFEPERPGQLRGIPFLAPTLNTLLDLKDLQDYEMRSAKANAQVTTFWKRQRRATSEVIEELYRGISNTVVDPAAAGKTTAMQDAAAGEVIIGEPGDEMQLLASNRPSLVTQEFWKFLIASICAGSEIPFQVAFPEFSGTIQGTSLRAQIAMLDSWFQARFQVIASALRRIYVYVIERHMESDTVLRARPNDWRRVILLAPRRISVDAQYDSTVTINELNANLLTLREVLGRRGIDWREHMRQIAEERQRLDELGLRQREVR